jgi:ribonuclease J
MASVCSIQATLERMEEKASSSSDWSKRTPPDIDVLLMEGTMLGRTSNNFPTESAVEDKIVEMIKGQRNTSFVICSSQNIDRLVSVFRACKKTGKTLVVDVYAAWVLEQMKLVSDRVPNMFWDEVKVIVPNPQYQVVKTDPEFFGNFQNEMFNPEHRIKPREILAAPADFVQAIRLSGSKFIEGYLTDSPVNVVYSQWLGYLEEVQDQYGADVLNRLRDDSRINFVYAHTTGHALLEDLKRLASSLSPKTLIPIHTECRDDFKEHLENVLELEDRQMLELT